MKIAMLAVMALALAACATAPGAGIAEAPPVGHQEPNANGIPAPTTTQWTAPEALPAE